MQAAAIAEEDTVAADEVAAVAEEEESHGVVDKGTDAIFTQDGKSFVVAEILDGHVSYVVLGSDNRDGDDVSLSIPVAEVDRYFESGDYEWHRHATEEQLQDAKNVLRKAATRKVSGRKAATRTVSEMGLGAVFEQDGEEFVITQVGRNTVSYVVLGSDNSSGNDVFLKQSAKDVNELLCSGDYQWRGTSCSPSELEDALACTDAINI